MDKQTFPAYPNPDDTDPRSRDRVYFCESPVCKGGNDRGNELCDTECSHESIRGTLHKEEAVGPGDEDKSLGDDGNLKVYDHVKLGVCSILVRDGGTELIFEEIGLQNDNYQNDSERKGQTLENGNEYWSYVDTVRYRP